MSFSLYYFAMSVSRYGFLVPCLLGAAGLFAARQAGDGTPGFYAATAATAIVYAVSWWFLGSHRSFTGPAIAAEIARGVAIGAVLTCVFVTGAVVVSRVPFLAGPVGQLLSTTSVGGVAPTLFVLVVNGIGEELVFRDVVPRQLEAAGVVHVGVASVASYVLVTVAMGVPLLLFAAAVIGAVAYYEAARSKRLYSPIALHLTWSVGMLFILPLFF